MGPLTDDERYAFDLQGFLVRRGVLSASELTSLHEAIESLGLEAPGETIQSQRFSGHLPRSVVFQRLIDHQAVFDVLVELCGRHVRLDHAYGIVMAPGTSGLGLHGGATPFDPAQYYLVRDGHIRCGLVAIQWALVDHPSGGGGFCCLPGSHKAGFPLPGQPDGGLVMEVPLAAGDLVVFTEALTHGTLDWQGPGLRRTLLYKYSPGSSTWADDQRWPSSLLAQLTERQRLLLQPPSVAYHQPVV